MCKCIDPVWFNSLSTWLSLRALSANILSPFHPLLRIFFFFLHRSMACAHHSPERLDCIKSKPGFGDVKCKQVIKSGKISCIAHCTCIQDVAEFGKGRPGNTKNMKLSKPAVKHPVVMVRTPLQMERESRMDGQRCPLYLDCLVCSSCPQGFSGLNSSSCLANVPCKPSKPSKPCKPCKRSPQDSSNGPCPPRCMHASSVYKTIFCRASPFCARPVGMSCERQCVKRTAGNRNHQCMNLAKCHCRPTECSPACPVCYRMHCDTICIKEALPKRNHPAPEKCAQQMDGKKILIANTCKATRGIGSDTIPSLKTSHTSSCTNRVDCLNCKEKHPSSTRDATCGSVSKTTSSSENHCVPKCVQATHAQASRHKQCGGHRPTRPVLKPDVSNKRICCYKP